MSNISGEYKSPIMAVPCPSCGAKIGRWCKRPSGHSGPMVAFHAARRKAAEAATTERARASSGGLKIGRMDILTRAPQAVDVLTLTTGQVLAVMRDGIELWPNLEAMLAADPSSDFAEMEAFFEYHGDCYVKDDPHSQAEPEEWQTTRFGMLRRTKPLWGIYIQDMYARGDYTVVELACGPALRIEDSGVTYWNSVQELVAATEPKPG